MKKENTAFEHYYEPYLKKECLSAEEFSKMVVDWLLGFDFYIADPVSGPQAYRAILDEIRERFPKSRKANKEDEEHLLRCVKCTC